LILWERHCDFNGAYCKIFRVGRVTGTTHIFLFGLTSFFGNHGAQNENLNLLVRIKFLNLFLYIFK